jgi:hypothetical protein
MQLLHALTGDASSDHVATIAPGQRQAGRAIIFVLIVALLATLLAISAWLLWILANASPGGQATVVAMLALAIAPAAYSPNAGWNLA